MLEKNPVERTLAPQGIITPFPPNLKCNGGRENGRCLEVSQVDLPWSLLELQLAGHF